MIEPMKHLNNYSWLLIFSIGLVWLFHISAAVGICLGHADWFLSKTPLNLSLAFFLLLLNYPVSSLKKWFIIILSFFFGILAEWLGVHYGLIFGHYIYGENLGPKISGVPLLIGVNWAVLILITGELTNRLLRKKWFRIISGGLLMVFIDFFMEKSAPVFDFWEFDGGQAPFQNYVGWFFLSILLHWAYQSLKIEGNTRFSAHLFICQLAFFTFFYVVNSI